MERLEADHYRELAAEARAAAERTHNDLLRSQFRNLAKTYDALAHQLERWEARRTG
jgi:hypothetical protein